MRAVAGRGGQVADHRDLGVTRQAQVGFDGDPIWSPIKENDLKYAINTNWDVFQDGPSKTLYLRDGKHWYTAMAVDGPWSPAGKLPESFKKLPADENWKEFRNDPEWKKVAADSEANGKIVEKVISVYMDPADFSQIK